MNLQDRTLAWGRLLRLSLMPSALADIAAGLVLGSGGSWPAGLGPWAMLLATLGVYHGAMALNDWSDREVDRSTRAERPLPSGAISAGAALSGALLLLATGIGAAVLAHPGAGLWMAAVALLAVLYDLRGRGPWLGPVLLGCCRFGNLGAGLWYGRQSVESATTGAGLAWLPAVLYGAYVFAVSRLARLEDDEDRGALGQRPRHALILASALLLALPLLAPGGTTTFARLLAWVLCAAGALGLLRCALTTSRWSRASVGAATGMGLRRLLVFTSACACLAWSPDSLAAPWVAAAALAGYPLSWGLRRVFPPT
jgi:4-hydroxybenzoate polyprenyltransferase